MKWQAIEIKGKNYNLDHLHPFAYDLIIPAKGDKPERKYHINVIFSLHCFTRGRRSGEVIPTRYSYSDNRETRIFDLDRYEKSFDLPGIVTSLSRRKCFHDPHNKFYVVEFMDQQGQKKYYSVFFELSKAGKKKGLNLYISSAYIRDDVPYSRNLKPIRTSRKAPQGSRLIGRFLVIPLLGVDRFHGELSLKSIYAIQIY